MVVTGDFLAVDWGTTNRRVFRIEGGRVAATERSPNGVSGLGAADYPAEIAGIRARMGDLPMLLAGMVGSTIGWRTVSYVAVPAGIDDLARDVARIDDRTAIVPGLSLREDDRADVMRGEEVQLLGAVAVGLAPADALLCQPGTHCKWAWMRGGAIADFTTAITGELFALLKAYSLIGHDMTGEVGDDAAFRAGAKASADMDLAATLFGVRAAGLLGMRPREEAASYVSGLLIGSDCHARLRAGGRDVHLLADPALGALYARAIAIAGGRAILIDSHAAFVAGIVRLWERLR